MKQITITLIASCALVFITFMIMITYKAFEQVTVSKKDGKIFIKRNFCQTKQGIESLDQLFKKLN